jgi:hypothetical protein
VTLKFANFIVLAGGARRRQLDTSEKFLGLRQDFFTCGIRKSLEADQIQENSHVRLMSYA